MLTERRKHHSLVKNTSCLQVFIKQKIMKTYKYYHQTFLTPKILAQDVSIETATPVIPDCLQFIRLTIPSAESVSQKDIIHCNTKGRVKLPKPCSPSHVIQNALSKLPNKLGQGVSFDEMHACTQYECCRRSSC